MITVKTIPRINLITFLNDIGVTLVIKEVKLGTWKIYFEESYLVRTVINNDLVLALEMYLLQVSGRHLYGSIYIPIITLTKEDKDWLYSEFHSSQKMSI